MQELIWKINRDIKGDPFQSEWPASLPEAWQSGYRAFSVGVREVEQISNYIWNQKEHHAVIGYQDEMRSLLREARLEFDERYLWD